MIFKCTAKTATVTDRDNLLCLCNFNFIPRNVARVYKDAFHLNTALVEKLLIELVVPFRKLRLSDEEIVCLCAIIVLNPMAKGLTDTGAQKVNLARNRVHDTLFQVVKESRGHEKPASAFGNLLLFLPVIASCAELCAENLRFAQAFSSLGEIPLISQLFGCFPLDSILQEFGTLPSSSKSCIV